MSELQCEWQWDGRAAFFQPQQACLSRAAEKCLRSLYSDMLGWPDRNPLIRKKRRSTLTTPSQVLRKHTRVSEKQCKHTAAASHFRPRIHTYADPCWILHADFPNNRLCEIRANGGQGTVKDWVRVYVRTCMARAPARMWSPERCWECWRGLSAWPVADRETEEPAQWDMAPLCLLCWDSREFQPVQIVIRSRDTLSHRQALFSLSETHRKWVHHWQVPHIFTYN